MQITRVEEKLTESDVVTLPGCENSSWSLVEDKIVYWLAKDKGGFRVVVLANGMLHHSRYH